MSITDDFMAGEISGVGIHLFNKVKNSIFEKEPIEKIIISKADFEEIIEEKVEVEEFPAISHKDIKAICEILRKSENIELIIKELYVFRSGGNRSLSEIKGNFVSLFPMKIKLEYRDQNLGTEERLSFLLKVFEVLDEGIQLALNRATDEGSSGALKALSNRRHLDTKNDLREIKKLIIDGSGVTQEKGIPDESGFSGIIEKYLENIIDYDSIKGISEVYTELSAKEILPITLKFHDKNTDQNKDFEVLELVEKEKNLIISGESGSGKSTTLRWLNFIFATRYLEQKEGIIPLYVELNSYIEGSFYSYLKSKAKKKDLSEAVFKNLLEGKLLLLLDGFGLLSPTDDFKAYAQISNFLSEYSACKFVVSSRPGFFESIRSDFKVSELEKLTDEKIRTFIDKYAQNEGLAEALKNEILNNPKLKSILANPLMLYLAIDISIKGRDNNPKNIPHVGNLLPETRSKLYETFVSRLFDRHKETGKNLHADSIQIENALKDLYFKLQCRNEVSCKRREALEIFKKHSEDPTFKRTTSQGILKDCIRLGLLVETDSETIGYGIHQSFQEYFAAIKLKDLFEDGYDVSGAFSHPKWEEVVLFTSEMLESVDEFINSMISKDELYLASKCAKMASDETKEKLCALLADKIDSK